jgi:arginyl-tRNA synthetase
MGEKNKMIWLRELEGNLIRGLQSAWGIQMDTLELQPTKEPQFGEFTTGIAFRLSKQLKKSPQEIAQKICYHILPSGYLEKIEPVRGYINIFPSKGLYVQLVSEVLKQGRGWGSSQKGAGQKVQIEFASANPTGPLTIAHGRQAAVGDILARLLEFYGYKVTREYYVNDCGHQIELLGRSIFANYSRILGKECPLPEDAYRGRYITQIAEQIANQEQDRYLRMDQKEALARLNRKGVSMIMEGIIQDLCDFGVRYDVYYSQQKLESSGKVTHLVEELKAQGLSYEREGALWLKTKEYGDVQDRVLVKSDGSYTYRVTDIAYHREKFERGFQRVIDLWGPDHHAHVQCMQAAIKMLGLPPEAFKVILVQFCTLYRGNQKVKMSTRGGEFVTLREVMQEVGRDAARYFLAARKTESHLDFDLERAKAQSMDNPVYYIQYAHARICSILKKGLEKGLIAPSQIAQNTFVGEADLNLMGEHELALASAILRFPFAIEEAVRNLDTQRLTDYAYALAQALQTFYQRGDKERKYRVLCEQQDTMRMRLKLVSAVRIVLQTCLDLLGISAPERM